MLLESLYILFSINSAFTDVTYAIHTNQPSWLHWCRPLNCNKKASLLYKRFISVFHENFRLIALSTGQFSTLPFFIIILIFFAFYFWFYLWVQPKSCLYWQWALCVCSSVLESVFKWLLFEDSSLRPFSIALNSWSLHLLMILWNVDNKIQVFCSFILSNVFLNTHVSFLLFILYMFFHSRAGVCPS